jgi:hypothetical protein
VSKNAEEKKDTVRFHYLKSYGFRTVHADGAMGGPTPRGKGLHIAFYAERAPIPTMTVHKVTDSQQLGEEILDERSSRDGIVRELEVDVVMDIGAARDLHGWLGQQLERHAEIAAKMKEAK